MWTLGECGHWGRSVGVVADDVGDVGGILSVFIVHMSRQNTC